MDAALFDAPALVVLSDADMVPSAYINGQLGPPAGSDALTVLRFEAGMPVAESAHLPVSNSVAGPPAPLAITPDGRYAISVETRGSRPEFGADVGLANLPKGTGVTVVDLSDLAAPRIVQKIEGPHLAETVSVSADGKLVAVAVDPSGDGAETPLWLYRFENGRLEAGTPLTIPDWRHGDHLVSAIFAPDCRRLALLNASRRSVGLFDLRVDGASPSLSAWGAAVDVGTYPFAIAFSPDGRFVFANANYADDRHLPQSPFGFPKGTIEAIRIDAQRDATGAPVHLITSVETTGRGPEAMAVSMRA